MVIQYVTFAFKLKEMSVLLLMLFKEIYTIKTFIFFRAVGNLFSA